MQLKSNVIVVFNGTARQPAKLEVGVQVSPVTPHAGDGTRYTYWFQKPAPARACGFDSHPAYQRRRCEGTGYFWHRSESSGFDSLPDPTVFPATTFHRRCVEKGYFALNPRQRRASRSGPNSRRKRFGGCGGVVGDRAGPFSPCSRR